MSPRPGPVRPIIGVRLGASELAAIDKRAKKARVTRSEMIRQLLAAALLETEAQDAQRRRRAAAR